jgi:hypothetical protein
MLNLSPQLRIANAAAVLDGPYGDITQRAHHIGLSRQALYRDTQALLQTLEGSDTQRQFQQLREQTDSLQCRIAELEAQLDQAFLFDKDSLAAFASTAQAEGVSLPVVRRLLVPLLAKPVAEPAANKRQLPSVAQLGRLTQQAARRSTALLAVLDEFSRARVQQAAADEIFFGKKPCLMVVEQHSLCWVSGRLAPRRTGEEWAKEFRTLPALRQTTQDGGQGLAKGLTLVNAERVAAGQTATVAQDDHFHILREGSYALRRMQGQTSRLIDKAEALARKAARKTRQTGDGRGQGAVARAWRRAEQAMDAWSSAEAVWSEVGAALGLFTPAGTLNTRAAATATLQAMLPRLPGPAWAKARRGLQRPELLTFLDKAQEELSGLPVAGELVAAAVRVEGVRRQPALVRGEGVKAAVMRGVLLAATLVLALAKEPGTQALTLVRGVLRGVWRASSLVECINSVVRMQQGRHRKMTQGLLDLKRLYWNCRAFRTGPRRGKSPYEHLGLGMPCGEWWQILRLTPEQLREQLRAAEAPAAAPPPQQLSAHVPAA